LTDHYNARRRRRTIEAPIDFIGNVTDNTTGKLSNCATRYGQPARSGVNCRCRRHDER
jgi:hypothetical protein